jgi:hypothetical protein
MLDRRLHRLRDHTIHLLSNQTQILTILASIALGANARLLPSQGPVFSDMFMSRRSNTHQETESQFVAPPDSAIAPQNRNCEEQLSI